MRLAPTLALVLGACSFRGDFDGTHYQCGAGQTCPANTVCRGDVCVPADQPDAALGPDAGATGRCSALGLLRDDFADATLARRWRTYAVGTQTIAPTDGALRITAPAGDNWGGVESRASYDFTDSQLEATVDAVGGWTGIEVIAADSKRLQLYVQDGALVAEDWVAGAQTARATVPYDAVAHHHWRLRSTAGDIIWETSPDGAAWTTLWTEPAPFDVAYVRTRISAGIGAAPLDVRIAEINTRAPTGQSQCAASTIQDDFAALSPVFATFSATDCTVAFAGGDLVLTSTAGAANSCGLTTRRLYDLTAGAVFVDAGGADSGPSHTAYLRATSDELPSARLEIARADQTLQFVQIAPDGTEATRVEVPYSPQLRYWQLRADGGLLHLGASPDGVTFTPYTNAALTFDMTAVRVTVGASHLDTAGDTVTSRFGGVNLP